MLFKVLFCLLLYTHDTLPLCNPRALWDVQCIKIELSLDKKRNAAWKVISTVLQMLKAKHWPFKNACI